MTMLSSRIGEGGIYGSSFVLTTAVIGNAFFQKKQFYPAVVYLTKSNPSLAVLGIQALIFVVLLGKLARKVFFGNLRAAEVEHLFEKFWYTVTETCLAFTLFRDDLNVGFVGMFTMLLFFKCFHWLAEDRVDFMERSPTLGYLFHIRMIGLISVLGLIDCLFIKQAYTITSAKGASSQVVFGFEYAILCTIVFTIFIKYSLHCIDLSDENPWEDKAVYLLYLELVTNGWKFALYVVFVVLMAKVHTFPLFAIRPLYLSMRGFKKALFDVILSRRAIRNMNQLYPDATEEDLQAVDDCIICRDPMQAQGACKKLPCSHIFHAACLRSWFQRQQTCPTCRMELLRVPATPAAPAQPAQPNFIPPPAGQGPPPPFHWQALHQQHAAARHARNFAPGTPQVPPTAATPTDANQPNNQNAQQPAGAPPHIPGFPAGFPAMPNINMMYGAAFPPGGLAGAAGGTPLMPPPGVFPFMSMPAPPMPTANIESLTEEELRRMESDEREALETRIQWVRDIQTLIDSAVEQMNQYTQVMSALNATRQPFRPASQSTPSLYTPPLGSARPETIGISMADGPQGAAGTTTAGLSAVSGARPKTRVFTATPSPVTSSSSPTINSPNKSAASSPHSASSTPEATSEQEELRRRRLAKFEQPHQES